MNKLLIFTEYFLPAKKGGGPVSSIRNLVELLHNDYKIGIVCFNHDMNSTEELDGISSNSWNDWNNKAQVFYADKHFMSRKNINTLVLDFKPDTIYLNAIFVHQFILFPIWAAKKINAKVVIASRGMLQEEALNQKKLKKRIYTTILNTSGFLNSVFWHSTNTNETNDILRVFKSDNIKMVTNVPIKPNVKTENSESQKLNFITISLNTRMKNIHFFLEVLKVSDQQINYDIYGPIKDEEYWSECKSIINTLPKNVTVNYKGEIDPDKINDVIPNYNLFVLPTLGENFGHAIFEAFACGVPVLISDRTPWRNLEDKGIGFDLELKENLWTETLESLDVEKLNTLRISSLEFAKSFFENGSFKQLYLDLFK